MKIKWIMKSLVVLVIVFLVLNIENFMKYFSSSHHSSIFVSLNLNPFKEAKKSTYRDIKKIKNNNFEYKFRPLYVEKSFELDLSGYKCAPISFGYSVSEGKAVFPPYEYPSCQTFTGIEESRMSVNRTKNLLTLKCDTNERGYYFAGPTKGYNMMKADNAKVPEIFEYKEPVNASKIEFGLGFCTNSTLDFCNRENRDEIDKYLLQHGSMTPIFNKTLYTESLKRVEKKPRIIFLLTIDSFSRNHFFRKLPKVVNYLNQSPTLLPNMTVYDFLMHTTYSSKSITNQGPVFGGKTYRKSSHPIGKDKLGTKSMWHFMKSKGYVTFMGMDNCNRDFPKVLGEYLNIDHMVREFYCVAQKYSTFHSKKRSTEQRCIGPYMSHYYVLNYTLEFLRMYKGTNMWIYLHLNAGHERTGQHAGTLDSHLLSFLTEYFQIVNDVYDTFMFFGADHGMRYGEWYKTVDAFQETKLPSMFVLASKSLLDQYPYSYHCLDENSRRLTSKLDIRETVFYLGGKELNDPLAVNLINDIASYGRKCKKMNVNPLFCACSKIIELNPREDKYLSLMNIARGQAQNFMNLASYDHPNFKKGEFCDHVELGEAVQFFKLEGDKKQFYQIIYESPVHDTLRLQVNIMFSRWILKIKDIKSSFRTFLFYYKNLTYAGKVLGLERLDKYSGKCQTIAEEHGILPEYCLRSTC